MTKAISKLGFNADIFMGLFDDVKYLAQVTEEFKEKPNVEKYKELLKTSKTLEELAKNWQSIPLSKEKDTLNELKETLKTKLSEKPTAE